MKRPIVIGVTGSFGTGKSTVSRLFGRLGARVINADKIAHETILPGHEIYKKIVSIFGPSILKKNKRIDRKKLANVVFCDKKRRLLLNSLIHPEVIKKIKGMIRKTKKRTKSVYVVDVPLLIEAGLLGMVDKLIVVTTDKKTQIKRCMARWGAGRADVERRIRSQMSLSRKRLLADFIIDNNGSLYATGKVVKKIWREIKNGGKD